MNNLETIIKILDERLQQFQIESETAEKLMIVIFS